MIFKASSNFTPLMFNGGDLGLACLAFDFPASLFDFTNSILHGHQSTFKYFTGMPTIRGRCNII